MHLSNRNNNTGLLVLGGVGGEGEAIKKVGQSFEQKRLESEKAATSSCQRLLIGSM